MKQLFLSVFSFFALNQATAAVKTVDSVDLKRYVGKWYEVASIPQRFQKHCVGNVTAEYTMLPEGKIKVINSCTKADGSMSVAEGRAKVVDNKTNAKLKVTFVKVIDWIFAFGGDYWIIDLDADYKYAVVGEGKNKYGWVLSRDPFLSDNDLLVIAANLKAQGYDTCQFLTTIQAGGFSQRMPLCEYLLKQGN